MEANAEIFFEHDRWGHNLAWSVALHLAVTGAIIGYTVFAPRGGGGSWGAGGGGEAMGVTLVSNVPLPANPAPTENVLANESKGIAKSQPQPVEEKLPDAIPIPAQDSKKKPKPTVTETHRKPAPQPVQEADNVVPFGEGGRVSGAYGTFSAAGAEGGCGVTRARG